MSHYTYLVQGRKFQNKNKLNGSEVLPGVVVGPGFVVGAGVVGFTSQSTLCGQSQTPFGWLNRVPAGHCRRLGLTFIRPIEYEIFGEGSHISTNQKREKGVFSLLIG